MIHKDLFSKVLMAPILDDSADELLIISGYATATMALNHLVHCKEENAHIKKVRLLIGMCPSDGIAKSNHLGFQQIMSSEYSKIFSCSYIHAPPPVHSKIYIWKRKGQLLKSFIGSANYTWNAFFGNNRESLAVTSDGDVVDYFNTLELDSTYCNHNEIEQQILISNDQNYYNKHEHEHEDSTIMRNKLETPKETDIKQVTVSLLRANGEIHNKAGLNWGQRDRREPNQAYIQLPKDVYSSNFFPLGKIHFTVYTDDSKNFICTRAQKSEEGHAIETPLNNSHLGEYFRNRLGLKSGDFIKKEHLEEYGRTDVTFYKYSEEEFHMDFSVKS